MAFKKKNVFPWYILVVLLSISGCASTPVIQKEMRAFIERTPSWNVSEKCGYEPCAPMVDFLTRKNMAIRIEFDNDPQTKQFFMIRTEFITVRDQSRYNVSNITLLLNKRDTLKPKVFTCYYTIWDLQYLRERPSMDGPLPIQKQDCYLLFFDHAALSANDEAILNLNDAITEKGLHIDVPLIHFKQNPGMQ